jgi:hypothetical protein
MVLDKHKILEKIYHDPSSPAGFSGQQRLYKEAKKTCPIITLKDVHHFLNGDRTYTLHRPRRIRFIRAKTIPSGLFTDIQADLAMMEKFARANKGYKYILVAVCILSKRLWAIPVKSKQYNDMEKAFDELLKQIPVNPARIFTDQGREFFLNKKIKTRENSKTIIKTINYFKEKDIDKHWSSTKTIKAALAERMIRVLKSRIYRYFSEKSTLNWLEVLPKIVQSINKCPSRITGMSPLDINFKNAQNIWEKVYGNEFDQQEKTQKSKHKIGDHVRLANYKEVFDRGFLPNWSDEIMDVESVKRGSKVDTYKIKDEHGEQFKGNFYAQDLGKTRRDSETSYRIKKVLGHRKTTDGIKQIRVEFFASPNQTHWIDESDIVN